MKTLMIGILIFVSFYCKSQDSVQVKKYNHEIGIDATYLLKTALTFNQYNPQFSIDNVNSIGNNYVLSYNYNFNKFSLRTGLGIDIAQSSTNDDANSLYDSVLTSSVENGKAKHTYIYFRIGVQKTNIITKKWLWYYGFDIVSSYKYSYSKSKRTYTNNYNNSTTEYNSTTLSLGLGPILGLKLKLNERISLITETSLYLSESSGIKDTKNTNYGESIGYREIKSHLISNDLLVKLTIPIFVILTFNI